MATEAQVLANRSNAQKSSGPRTPEGKATVAQNAVKHGLLAKEAVVVGEDLEEFDLYRDQMRADLAPVGMVESLLVERIVGLSWRLQRAERFHTAAFDMLYLQCASDPQTKRWQPAPGPDGADPIFGLTVVKDFSQTKVLERLLMYERRIESSLYRTMAELRNLRRLHEQDAAKAGAVGSVPVRAYPEVLSVRYEPAREQSQASSPPNPPTSDSLPPTSDSTVRTGDETPDSVTTNGADAERQSCETKPIGEGVSSLKCQVAREEESGKCEVLSLKLESEASCPPGLPTSHFPLQTSDSKLDTAAEPLSCETKPISGGVIKDGEGYRPIFRRRR